MIMLAALALASAQPCAFAPADQAWLDRATAAWTIASRDIAHARLPVRIEARIADARCLAISATAMLGQSPRWRYALHGGKLTVPGGQTAPIGPIAFATSQQGRGLFVMTTPSVWRAGKVDGGPLGLDTLMVAVLLHEGMHVAQTDTYGRAMERLSTRWHLPESFGDDSIQERFQGNRAFAADVAAETDLLLRAAAAPTRAQARTFAARALATLDARRARFFPAADGYLTPAEDIWLTMEGSAQWVGYRWLIDPHGGRLSPATALAGFGRRSKWWTQTEGFALFMALERLTPGRWQRHAFADGATTGPDLLRAAVR